MPLISVTVNFLSPVHVDLHIKLGRLASAKKNCTEDPTLIKTKASYQNPYKVTHLLHPDWELLLHSGALPLMRSRRTPLWFQHTPHWSCASSLLWLKIWPGEKLPFFLLMAAAGTAGPGSALRHTLLPPSPLPPGAAKCYRWEAARHRRSATKSGLVLGFPLPTRTDSKFLNDQ